MTAPLDIGLEQNDASLNMGQDDMFDLVDTQRELRKQGGINRLISDDEMPSDEEEGVEEAEGSDEEFGGSDEGERRISVLEADMDSMYDAYREKLKERDAKYRVAEARKKKGQLEEWSGLGDENDVGNGDDSSEDGGWEDMATTKEIGDPSSDDSDYDEPTSGQKRKRPNPVLRKHNDVQPPSRAAQVWFSQDIFKEVGKDEEDDGDEDVEMASKSSKSQQDDQGDKVYHRHLLYLILTMTRPRRVISRSSPLNLETMPTYGTLRMKMWTKHNRLISRVRFLASRLDQD